MLAKIGRRLARAIAFSRSLLQQATRLSIIEWMPRPPKIKRATDERKLTAVYIRHSSDQQKDSPERQLHDNTTYAQKNGYEVVGVYSDAAISGINSSSRRGGLAQCLEDAQAGKFRYLLCWQQSRISRSDVRHLIQELNPFADIGVKFVWTDKGERDLDEFTDFLLMAIDGNSNIEYVRKVVQGSLSGRAKKAREGKWPQGATPYAYSTDDSGRLILHPDDQRVRLVRDMLNWYLEGASDRRIISMVMDKYGIKIGQSFVQKNLTDPINVGDFTWPRRTKAKMFAYCGGEVTSEFSNGRNGPEDQIFLPNNHPPVFERDKWLAGLRQRKSNAIRTTPLKPDNNPHFLTGLCRCAHCGSSFVGRKTPRRLVITCNGYREGKCLQYTIDAYEVLSMIAEGLSTAASESHVNEVRRSIQKRPDAKVDVASLRRQLVAKKKSHSELVDKISLLPAELMSEFGEKVMESKRSITALEERIRSATVSVEQDLESLDSQVKEMRVYVSRLSDIVANIRDTRPQLVNSLLKAYVFRVILDIGAREQYHDRWYLRDATMELNPSTAGLIATRWKHNQVRF